MKTLTKDIGIVSTLGNLLREDFDWAWSWHCNIAMSARDEGVGHETANRAAARFMKLAFDLDTLAEFEKRRGYPFLSNEEPKNA